MKLFFYSAVAFMLLSGCSESNIESNDSLIPINLGAGVHTLSTKAPITSGDQVQAGIAGWEHTGTVDYTATPTWDSGISVEANPNAQAVSWTTQKYYNANNATKTYIKAWHPKGSLTGTEVTITNDNGDQDMMLAAAISGSKDNKFSAPLEFQHKTTQLNFKVVADATLETGTTLTSITVKDVQLPTGFNLATDVVNYAVAADFAVKGITTSPAIGTTASNVGSPLMISPISNKTFTVDVVTNKASYMGKIITVSTATIEQGTAYEVTLTFKQSGIDLTTKVADWKTATGSGDIM